MRIRIRLLEGLKEQVGSSLSLTIIEILMRDSQRLCVLGVYGETCSLVVSLISGDVRLASAWEIVAIFALMFTGITVAALWFAHSSSKIQSKKEIQKRKIEVIDRHFNEMLRIECPYCKTVYRPSEPRCPNCSASVKELLFPEMPE